MNKKILIKTFEKTPLIGGLINCSKEDFSAATKELLSTLFIAMSPIWLGAFFLWCYSVEGELNYITILLNSLRNGELMIYCTSLLAPVFYITSSDKYTIVGFPNKLSSIITAVVILMITTAVYAIQKSGASYNRNILFNLSIFLFCVSLIILFVNKVYNNSKIGTYLDVTQNEEKNFTSQLGQRKS